MAFVYGYTPINEQFDLFLLMEVFDKNGSL